MAGIGMTEPPNTMSWCTAARSLADVPKRADAAFRTRQKATPWTMMIRVDRASVDGEHTTKFWLPAGAGISTIELPPPKGSATIVAVGTLAGGTGVADAAAASGDLVP
jgi:hypothetical protein